MGKRKNPFSYAIDYDSYIKAEATLVAACEHPLVAEVVKEFAGRESDYTSLLMFLFDNRGLFEDADVRRSFDTVAKRVRIAVNRGRLSDDLSEWSDYNDDFEYLWPCEIRDGYFHNVDFERGSGTEHVLVALLLEWASMSQLNNLGEIIKSTRAKAKRDLSRHRRNRAKYRDAA